MKKIIILFLILSLIITIQVFSENEINLNNNLNSSLLAGVTMPAGVSDQVNDLADKIGIDQQYMIFVVLGLALFLIGIVAFIIITCVKLMKVNKNLKIEKQKKKDLDKMVRIKKQEDKKKKKESKERAKIEEKNRIVKSVKQDIVIEKPVQKIEKSVKTEEKSKTSENGEEDNLTDEDIYIVNKEIQDIKDGNFETKTEIKSDNKTFTKIENPDDEFLLDIDSELSDTSSLENKDSDKLNIDEPKENNITLKEVNKDDSLNIDETLNKELNKDDLSVDEVLKSNENGVMSEETNPIDNNIDNLIDFSNINEVSDITNENIILDKPKFQETILDKKEKSKITDIPADVKIIDDKQEKNEEVFTPESKIFGDKKIFITKKTTVLPKCFESYLQQADESVKWVYNELKNELLSYKEVHSRIITGCEIFRKSGIQAKMLIKGKTLYIYLRISTEGIDPTYVKVKDMSKKKAYVETPTEIRVSGKKKVNRCKELIAAMFTAQGVEKSKEYEYVDYAKDYPTIPNAVIYSRNLVYKN